MTTTAQASRRALVALLVLGAVVHFVGITSPRQVVFDEVHMGKFVSAYCCTGVRIFDVHPPHGKLLIALAAKLGGYDGYFTFEKIGQPYGPDVPVFFLRLVPALAGIALAPLFFLLLRHLGASVPAAFLGGLFVALDNAMLLETKIILFDGILLASILGSLVCFFAADAAPPGRARLLNVASGALAGLAFGSKFTGLVAMGLITVVVAVRLFSGRGRATPAAAPASSLLGRWALIGAMAVVVYAAGWWLHFHLLTLPGPGDGFYRPTGNFITDFVQIHKTMFAVNYNLSTPHPDSSAPWTWPLMKVPPYFWVGDSGFMYMLGNPVVWWGGSLLFLVLLANWGLMKVTRLRLDTKPGSRAILWFPLVGYVMAFLPFFGLTRVLFMYHYFSPLLFSTAFVMLWLDRAGWFRSDRLGDQAFSYYATIAALVVAFLLVSPVTYGFSAGGYDDWLANTIRSWR